MLWAYIHAQLQIFCGLKAEHSPYIRAPDAQFSSNNVPFIHWCGPASSHILLRFSKPDSFQVYHYRSFDFAIGIVPCSGCSRILVNESLWLLSNKIHRQNFKRLNSSAISNDWWNTSTHGIWDCQWGLHTKLTIEWEIMKNVKQVLQLSCPSPCSIETQMKKKIVQVDPLECWQN